jgi:hypothetical protein
MIGCNHRNRQLRRTNHNRLYEHCDPTAVYMVSHPRQKSTFYIHNNFLFSTQLFIFNTTFYFQHNFLFSTQLFIFNTTFFFQHNFLFSTQLFFFNTTFYLQHNFFFSTQLFFSNRNPLIYHGSRARFCTLMISPVTTI